MIIVDNIAENKKNYRIKRIFEYLYNLVTMRSQGKV